MNKHRLGNIKSEFVFFKWMRPRKKYPLNQESKRIVGKNRCDLKGKYLLNRKSRRIVGKNACVPRKKYPLYQERWNLIGKFKFVHIETLL